jgi:alkanesulfonate monooxygenase SsuD/methylene tetrahydromethanopterin reductase-like flavin-dependent oxidoreductase (luciferase family)
MRFGINQEAETHGITHATRLKEVIKEAQYADEWGFDFWGTSEQHFTMDGYTVSAPEVLFGAVAALTHRIQLRHQSIVMLKFNHPIRVAERLATLDCISNGRAAMSAARSNSIHTLEAFEVDPNETREMSAEALDVLLKAFTMDPFEHKGKYWNIPPRSLVPKPVQYPHPPIFYTATSIESCESAGKRGLGLIVNDNWYGWDYTQQMVNAYKAAVANAQPVPGSYVNNSIAYAVFTAHCAETNEKARQEASRVAEDFITYCINLYSKIAPTSPGYAYIENIKAITNHKSDLDFIMDKTPSTMVGDPDYFIKQIKRLQALGFDEVRFRLDGLPHDQIMKSIELIGKYVIPEFKSPGRIVPDKRPVVETTN